MRIWEIKLAAEFSPLSVGFACSVDMVLFSVDIFFELSFSLDFSYIKDEFVQWVKDWVAGESDGENAKELAAASSALGAPHAPGFNLHPSFDATSTHGRVYSGTYDTAKRSVAPRARSRALVEAQAFLGSDDTDHMAGGDLSEHIDHEHERHASLIGLMAASRAHHAGLSSSSTPPALGAALRAAPVQVTAHMTALLGTTPVYHDDWVVACDPNAAVDVKSDAHDVCDSSAVAAAVACASTPGSTDCAYALSALRSRHCAQRPEAHITNCASVKRLQAAFPTCSHRCVAAMHGVGSACAFIVPRSHNGRLDEKHSPECHAAAREAQKHCALDASSRSSEDSGNHACMDALSAVPHSLVKKARAHSAAFMGGKHVLRWSEARAHGVLHDGICDLATEGHLDLRGNAFIGSVPACMISDGESSGNLFISRNQFSGEMGKVGAHVSKLYANDNEFTGHLSDALEKAGAEMTTLKVSGNKFTGGYSFLKRMTSLEHLDIEDNNLGEEERHEGESVPQMIASLGSMKHYAMAGNKFAPGALRTSPAAKKEVHVTLVLRLPAHKFCSGCMVAARLHTHECAAVETCRGARDENVAGRLECVLAAHAPEGSVAKIERVVPHVGEDGQQLSVAAITILLPATNGEQDETVDADDVARNIERLVGGGEGPIWNREAAGAASCDQRDVYGSAYRGAEVVRVVARAACAAGHSGDECLHFCPTTWSRVDEKVRTDTIAREKPTRKPESASYAEVRNTSAAARASPALGASSSLEQPLKTYHKSLHYVYDGIPGERLPFSTALESCTVSCRSHATMAIVSCNEWLRQGKQTAAGRFACRTAITEMHAMCKSSRDRESDAFCAGGKSSYTLKPDQSHDDHECEVCGIHHLYAQHGAMGGADLYKPKELRARKKGYQSPYTPSDSSAQLGHLERRAVLAELADVHDEAGLGEHVDKETMMSLAKSFLDGHGPEEDMNMIDKYSESKAEMKAMDPAPLTLEDIVEGQFAKCRVPTSCSRDCSVAVDTAIGKCGEWAQSPGALRRVTEAQGADELKMSCAAALTASKVSCSGSKYDEEAYCAAPIIKSYAKFGIYVRGYEGVKLQRSRSRVAVKALGKTVSARTGRLVSVPLGVKYGGYKQDVVLLEECNPVGLTEYSLYDVCALGTEQAKIDGWSGKIACAVKGFDKKIEFQAWGMPRLVCKAAKDGLYELDIVGKITADHIEANLPQALRAPANANMHDLLIPKSTPARLQKSASSYKYSVRYFKNLANFGEFGCKTDGDGNAGIMLGLKHKGEAGNMVVMQSECSYAFPAYGVTYTTSEQLSYSSVESGNSFKALFDMIAPLSCGGVGIDYDNTKVMQNLKLKKSNSRWRLHATCVNIIPAREPSAYLEYSECFQPSKGHYLSDNMRMDYGTMSGQMMKCKEDSHAISAFKVYKCNDASKSSWHQFRFVCQPLLAAKKNAKILPYTSAGYSPTTINALTFNNDLFLGSLTANFRFHGKVMKLSDPAGVADEDVDGDDVVDVELEETMKGCVCLPSYEYNEKKYTSCTKVDWPVKWCATPEGCGYPGSSKPSKFWDDCNPPEKKTAEPHDYTPAFTQVTIRATGVNPVNNQSISRVLPEWANEKILSLTIQDEKGSSNKLEVAESKPNENTVSVHAEMHFNVTDSSGLEVEGTIPEVMYTGYGIKAAKKFNSYAFLKESKRRTFDTFTAKSKTFVASGTVKLKFTPSKSVKVESDSIEIDAASGAIKVTSENVKFDGVTEIPSGQFMMRSAITAGLGGWTAMITGVEQAGEASWIATSNSNVSSIKIETTGPNHVRFDHADVNISISGFEGVSSPCEDKSAFIAAAGTIMLNRGVLFAGRADGTADPMPTVAVTFPVKASISCNGTDVFSKAEATASMASYEISDYVYLKDVAITFDMSVSSSDGGIIKMMTSFDGKVDLSRSITGLAFHYGELDVTFKTSVKSSVGGMLQSDFEEELLGRGSFMIEMGPSEAPDMTMARSSD
jgi:hypothetical protein